MGEWNKDSDIHQLLSYLFLTGGERYGVIYPSDNNEDSVEYKELKAFDSLYDNAPRIYKLPLFIPKSENIEYMKYSEEIEKSVLHWKEILSEFV